MNNLSSLRVMLKSINLIMKILILLLFHNATYTESMGNLAQYPPTPKDLIITTSKDGMPILEPFEISLNTGKYYRLNIICPDVKDDLTGWRIEMSDLLRNSHLRLVTVGDIEIHLQGLSFHAVECDEIGSAHVSFVPIKPGSYQLYVGNVPSAVRRPIGEAGIQEKGKYVLSRFIVN